MSHMSRESHLLFALSISCLASCDESSKTVDTNKTWRSDKVHDMVTDDNDSRDLFESTVK